MPRRTRPLLLLALVALTAPAGAAADAVVPAARVSSRVLVRERPEAGSPRLGDLRPGERGRLLGSQEGWHQVELDDGVRGWVSAGWTEVVVEAAPPPPAPPPPPAAAEAVVKRSGAFTRFWRRLFRRKPAVDFVIREPAADRSVHRHTDPSLPVSGYATATGSHLYDVILMLDTSTSTNETASTDVDGDGVVDREWKGADTVFRAQVVAADRLVGTLARLPGNREGERIRLAVVTFAGDEGYHLHPADADFQATADALYALAGRDTRVVVPLTGDYAAVRAGLAELAATEPVGMTNFAAAIGRALVELYGMTEWGARSRPRAGAQKLVLFLSDGEPRLPFDHRVAETAGIDAGRIAAEAGVRVNTFALGRNPVTQQVNPAIVKMAMRSDGRFVAVENPGEIVTALDATGFGFVDRVQLINRTSDRESGSIATGIDGSFYGEVDLVPGMNEIEVVAHLVDDREASKTIFVEFQEGTPDQELVDQLERVRRENQALIDQIRRSLAREMESNRADDTVPGRRPPDPQDKRLKVRIEKVPQEKVLQMEIDAADADPED